LRGLQISIPDFRHLELKISNHPNKNPSLPFLKTFFEKKNNNFSTAPYQLPKQFIQK
jgi:hypothetical protein